MQRRCGPNCCKELVLFIIFNEDWASPLTKYIQRNVIDEAHTGIDLLAKKFRNRRLTEMVGRE